MEQIHQNNIKFLELKEKYNLTISDIAKLLLISNSIIRQYSATPNTPAHAICPDSTLNYFKLAVKNKRVKKT